MRSSWPMQCLLLSTCPKEVTQRSPESASGEGGLGGEDIGLPTYSETKLRQEETGERGGFAAGLLFLGPLGPRLHVLGA